MFLMSHHINYMYTCMYSQMLFALFLTDCEFRFPVVKKVNYDCNFIAIFASNKFLKFFNS